MPLDPHIRLGVTNGIRAHIKNFGPRAVVAGEASVRLGFYAFGNSDYRFDVCEALLPAIGIGQTVPVTCPWTPSIPGHGCLKAELIYTADVTSTNNCAQHNIDVEFAIFPESATFRAFVSNPLGFKIHVRLRTTLSSEAEWELDIPAGTWSLI